MAERIGSEMVAWPQPGACPDCGGAVFQLGPRGGAAQNIRCVGCGAWWNAVWLPDSSGLVQRIRDLEGAR